MDVLLFHELILSKCTYFSGLYIHCGLWPVIVYSPKNISSVLCSLRPSHQTGSGPTFEDVWNRLTAPRFLGAPKEGATS